jgi:hypothetical protein
MIIQILKLYGESWPKFKKVTKKSTDPSDVSNVTLSFDEKSTFDCFALFRHIKRGSLYMPK